MGPVLINVDCDCVNSTKKFDPKRWKWKNNTKSSWDWLKRWATNFAFVPLVWPLRGAHARRGERPPNLARRVFLSPKGDAGSKQKRNVRLCWVIQNYPKRGNYNEHKILKTTLNHIISSHSLNTIALFESSHDCIRIIIFTITIVFFYYCKTPQGNGAQEICYYYYYYYYWDSKLPINWCNLHWFLLGAWLCC